MTAQSPPVAASAVATGAIATDDRAAVDDAALPAQIAAARAAHDAAVAAHTTALAHHATVAAIAARAPALVDDVATLAAIDAEHASAVADSVAARADIEAARSDAYECAGGIATIEADIAAFVTERATVDPRARHASRLDTAVERIADLEHAIAHDTAALARIDAAIAALPAQQRAASLADHDAITSAGRTGAVADIARTNAIASQRTHATTIAQLQRDRVRLGDPASRVAAAYRAGATLATLQPQIEAARAAVQACDDDAATMPQAPAVVLAQRDRDGAAVALCGAVVTLARAEDAVVVTLQQHERIARLDGQRKATALELARWSRLAADLGRNGLQADLVDSVAPELTDTANDLLRASLGPRWTIAFEASRVNADGDVVEGFAIRVTDGISGESRDAADWCGGETALISNAVADAVAVVACRRSGMDAPTVVRDEADMALDKDNRAAWVRMVRRTADITHASRVFLVSHRPDTIAACDCVVEVRDGRVTVL